MNLAMLLNPAAYGYAECSWCCGYGSSLKEDSDRCTHCGGSGLVRKAASEPASVSHDHPWHSMPSIPHAKPPDGA